MTRFWVGGTGTWDASDTTHWSATDGGTAGASVPVSTDDVTFNANSGGGTVTVGYDPAVLSITMGAFSGTVDFNTRSPTMGTFNCSGTGIRTLTMGSGVWVLTGSGAALWNMNTVTGLTFTATTATINCTYAGSTGTRTFTANNTFTPPNLNVTAGSDTFQLNTITLVNLSWSGFTGTWGTNGLLTLTGNLTMGSGMQTHVNVNVVTFSGTSGSQTITSNGIIIDRPFVFDGVGGSFQFADTFVGGATRLMWLKNGTLNFNNQNIKVGQFSVSALTTRTLTMGSGILELTGTGTVFEIGSQTGLTLNVNTSTIKITDTSSTQCTFSGINATFNNIWWARGASTATNTVIGANTYNDFRDNGSVTHILVMPNSTSTVNTWSVSGTANNLVTITRTGGSGQWTLSKASGIINSKYLSISNGIATGGAAFYAGASSTDGGGNTGWIFTDAPILGSRGRSQSTANIQNLGRL